MKPYILLAAMTLWAACLPAQTLEQAKSLFKNKEYAKAKPVFQRYVKNNPGNASYNYWYGACCYETGEKDKAEKYLLVGAKRRVQEAFRYLGQLYFETYRFDEAADNYASYIEMLQKAKKETVAAEHELARAKEGARMLKGVEKVTFVDSVVVDKADLLEAYHIGHESGRLARAAEYTGQEEPADGTAYETELGNKRILARWQQTHWDLYSTNKQLQEWSRATPLAGNVNTPANENYPYMLSDGITFYYAADGEGSLGGYDIFVTRYNTENDTFFSPENVGMPFNSPANDYLMVIDEFNNLGWFASDRYQPEGKVCVYVFVPNASKETFNYENDDTALIRRRAQLTAIADTWGDTAVLKAAKQRMTIARYDKPEVATTPEFAFVIDDQTTYQTEADFRCPEAQAAFKQWQQKKKDWQKLADKLEQQRDAYSRADAAKRQEMRPALLDLEQRAEQMEVEIRQAPMEIRRLELTFLKQ